MAEHIKVRKSPDNKTEAISGVFLFLFFFYIVIYLRISVSTCHIAEYAFLMPNFLTILFFQLIHLKGFLLFQNLLFIISNLYAV